MWDLHQAQLEQIGMGPKHRVQSRTLDPGKDDFSQTQKKLAGRKTFGINTILTIIYGEIGQHLWAPRSTAR